MTDKTLVSVANEDGAHSEFSVDVQEDKIVVNYGDGGDWTHPGKEAYTITDDGNGLITVYDHITKKKSKIELLHLEALEMVRKLQGDSPKVYKKELIG